jgi:hypothetical protein
MNGVLRMSKHYQRPVQNVEVLIGILRGRNDMPDFAGPGPQLDRIEKIIKKADRVAKIALLVSIIALAAAVVGLIPVIKEMIR